MPKLHHRIVAILLVHALIADPVTASVFFDASALQPNMSDSVLTAFGEQAIVGCVTNTVNSIIAWGKVREVEEGKPKPLVAVTGVSGDGTTADGFVRALMDTGRITLTTLENDHFVFEYHYRGELVAKSEPRWGHSNNHVPSRQYSPRYRIRVLLNDQFVGFADVKDVNGSSALMDSGFFPFPSKPDQSSPLLNGFWTAIEVIEPYRGRYRGIGQTLMGLSMRIARRLGTQEVLLKEVKGESEEFFTRLGFRPFEYTHEDYDNGTVTVQTGLRWDFNDLRPLPDLEIRRSKVDEQGNTHTSSHTAAPAQAVFFDLDGTLIELLQVGPALLGEFSWNILNGRDRSSWKRDLTVKEQALGMQYSQSVKGLLPAQLETLYQKAGRTADRQTLQEMITFFGERMLEERQKPSFNGLPSLFTGVEALLRQLDANKIAVYVLSGAPQNVVDQIVNFYGLSPYITEAIGTYVHSEGEFPSKDSEIAKRVKEKRWENDRVVMVGDGPGDMQAAAAAGVRGVWVVPKKVSEQEMKTAGAHAQIPEVQHLASALNDIGLTVDPAVVPEEPGRVEILHPEALNGFDLQTLLWDWDNTIWKGYPHDLEERLWARWAFQTENPSASQIEKTHTFFKDAQGLTREETITKWRNEGHPDPGGFDDMLSGLEKAVSREALEHRCTESYLLTGVRKILESIRSHPGIRQIIMTGGHREHRKSFAERLGIYQNFDGIHGGEPKVGVVERYVSECGGKAATHVAVIGDGRADIEAAKKAGALAIGFAETPEKRDMLIAAGADIIINGNYLALAKILEILKLNPPHSPTDQQRSAHGMRGDA